MNNQNGLIDLLQNVGVAEMIQAPEYDKYHTYTKVNVRGAKGAKGTKGVKGAKGPGISTRAAMPVNTTVAPAFNHIKTSVSEVAYPNMLKPYQNYINTVVDNILANNTSLKRDVVLNAKIRQLKYFSENSTWATEVRNLQAIPDEDARKNAAIALFEKTEMDVYENDWKESKEHLESYNNLEQLQPNSSTVCRNCRQKTVYVHQSQVRGNDEGATTFYRCLSCGKTWSES